MLRRAARILFLLGFLIAQCRAGGAHGAPRGSMGFRAKDALQQGISDDATRESLIASLATATDDGSMLKGILDRFAFVPERDVAINLFTRENPDEAYVLKINDAENLRSSPFSAERKTKVIIHGWFDSANSDWVKEMRANYLAAGNYNVISVDWSVGSFKEYFASARLTRQVGEYLGAMLQYLSSEGNLAYSDVHIVGHSLGAHVAGFAGASTSGQVGRITGLDPARPAFEAPVFRGENDRLDPSDAQFVDVIHTCAGTAGFVTALGDVDFYPNGGSFIQPGCSVITSQFCSHARSYQFMTESITGAMEFVATSCDSWNDYKAGKCEGNSVAIMGENASPDSRGKFYLETNAQSPFAQGVHNSGA